MIGIILGIRHNVIRQDAGHIVLKIHDGVDKPVEKTGRQEQVTVIGEHCRSPKKTAAQRHAGRVKLRQMHLNHVMSCSQFCGDPPKGGSNHAFADASCDRHTDDLYPVQGLFEQQRRIILRGHHRDLMPAFDEGPRQALGIDGQARGMGPIVCQNCEDFHRNVPTGSPRSTQRE